MDSNQTRSIELTLKKIEIKLEKILQVLTDIAKQNKTKNENT